MENKENNIPKNKNPKRVALLIIVLAIVLVVGSLCITYSDIILEALGLSNKSEAMTQTAIDNRKYELLNAKSVLYENFDEEITVGDGNTVNILVFGMDRNSEREDDYEYFRPDTIILATVNLNDLSIKLVSIPRDTYVPIHGRGGKAKVNACFYYGAVYADEGEDEFTAGVECLKGTISDLLNVPINYYAGVDMDGVVGIIDTLGGVETNVHDEIYIHGEFKLHAGPQVLNGKDFLTYARCRDYAMGDIGRVSVQQQLLKDLFKTATSTKNITKLPKLVQQAFDMVITDITFEQATALAFSLMDFSSENIKTGTIPGTFGNLNSVSYWIINQSSLRSFAKEWYGVSIPSRTQDPTSDKLKSLSASSSSIYLNAGGSTGLTLTGSHADGKERTHELSSCSVSVGDSSVARVSGNSIVAVGNGSTTITFTKSGVSVSVTVHVSGYTAPEPETPEPPETPTPQMSQE